MSSSRLWSRLRGKRYAVVHTYFLLEATNWEDALVLGFGILPQRKSGLLSSIDDEAFILMVLIAMSNVCGGGGRGPQLVDRE